MRHEYKSSGLALFTYEHGMETKGPTSPFSFLGLHQTKLSNNSIVYLCNVGALTNNDKMDILHLCVRVGVGRVTIIMIS